MDYSLGRIGIVVYDSYDNTKTYQPLDLVPYNGGSYIARCDTVGHLPTVSQYWTCIASPSGGSSMAAHAVAYPRGSMTNGTYYMMKWTQVQNSDSVNLEPWKLTSDSGFIRGWKVKQSGWYRFSHILRWNSGSNLANSIVYSAVVPSINVASIADTLTTTQIEALSPSPLVQYLPGTTSSITQAMTTDCVYMAADTVIVVFATTTQVKTQETVASFGRFSIERVA